MPYIVSHIPHDFNHFESRIKGKGRVVQWENTIILQANQNAVIDVLVELQEYCKQRNTQISEINVTPNANSNKKLKRKTCGAFVDEVRCVPSSNELPDLRDHPIRELAGQIIDWVENKIRVAHPQVDKIAEEYVEYVNDEKEKPNTLLYGENYYDLEDKITKEIAAVLLNLITNTLRTEEKAKWIKQDWMTKLKKSEQKRR